MRLTSNPALEQTVQRWRRWIPVARCAPAAAQLWRWAPLVAQREQ